MPREISIKSRLRRVGVKRLQSAEKWLDFSCYKDWVAQEEFWSALQGLPQVDQVLLVLADLGELQEKLASSVEIDKLLQVLGEDLSLRAKLFRIWGSSKFVADYTRAHLKELIADSALLSTALAQERPLPSREEIWTEFCQVLKITQVGQGEESAKENLEASLAPSLVSPADIDNPCLGDYLAGAQADPDQLRQLYYKLVIQIFAQDITSPDPAALIPQIMEALSNLASCTVAAALAIAKRDIDPRGEINFSVIALGKCGAKELNYCSDIDLIYVGEAKRTADDSIEESLGVEKIAKSSLSTGEKTIACPRVMGEKKVLAIGAKLAGRIQEICYSSQGEYPPLWPIDTALRPEGKDGAIVRSVDSYVSYYQKWAKNWEFQALLKARPIAGNQGLGEKWFNAVYPMVWERREDFVSQAQSMRERVEDNIPREQLNLHLKLGAGGLRDIEFSIQLLQLVHGRLDPRLRVRATLPAISVLAENGYIGRQAAQSLDRYYRFLRLLEHRRQTERFKRTHLLPANLGEWEKLGLTLPINYQEDLAQEHHLNAHKLEKITAKIRGTIRSLQQEIFYRPLLSAIANLSTADASLSKDAALERLQSFGYLDPRGALGHIAALTQGISRRATIQKHILPVLLEWFTLGPNPDAGLLRFRQLSEAIGDSHWYMGLLRDSAVVAQRLCMVLSTSSYISARLEHVPQAVQWLESESALQPLNIDTLESEMSALVKRHQHSKEAVSRLRAVRGRELLRQALADVINNMEINASLQAVSQINLSTLKLAAQAVQRDFSDLPELAFIILGRAGGNESTYASDLDMVVVFKDDNEADKQAENPSRAIAFATRLREVLQEADNSPELMVDYDLRPEGREGALARSLASFVTYYERWAQTWEYQALLRAQVLALPGQENFAQEVREKINLLLRARTIDESNLREIRQLKARMERERIPGGKDKSLHVKLGPGGLADVEWVAQVLQMQHVHSHPAMLSPSTRQVLKLAREQGWLSEEKYQELLASWKLAGRIRNANVLITNRLRGAKLDFLPQDPGNYRTMARLLGYPAGAEHELAEDWLRYARRSRKIMEEIFYS